MLQCRVLMGFILTLSYSDLSKLPKREQMFALEYQLVKELTYLHKPMRVYGKDASRLTSPSLTVKTRDMQGKSTNRPLEMRIGNEGVSYFKKYQPLYIEGDDDNMLYFIYDIKRKEEVTLFYIKPEALDFQDSQKLQEAFANKDSFDLYTVFVRDDITPRVSKHDFDHFMTVSDWTGDYGFKVFIPALGETGKTYIALKPSKDTVQDDPAKSTSKRRRRSIVDTYFDDDIYFDVVHRRYRRSTNSSADNTTTTTPAPIDVTSFRPVDANFSVIIATTSCRSWDDEQEAWVTNGCEVTIPVSGIATLITNEKRVLEMSSLNETVCRCKDQKGNVFATTFYVPPNTIDFSTVFSKFDLSNAAVYGTLLCLFVLYFILLVWARRQDKRDIERWAAYFLADSDESDNYFYLITVHTGLRRGAGTKSKVYFVLSGEKADTGVRTLTDGINEGFETGSTRKFFMGTSGPLNDVTFLRIWHDNTATGNDNSWFLYKFIVDDLQTKRRYIFACDNWLAVEYGDGLIDRIIPVSDTEQMLVFEKLFSGHARYNITESHLWLSLLMRPEKSYFTRVQRLSCILALLLLTMIASAMFYRDSNDDATPDQIKIGFIRFSLTTLYVSLVSVLITTPPILLITIIFKNARPARRKDEKMTAKMLIVVKEAQESNNINKQMIKDKNLLEELFVDEKRPLPHWTIYIAWVLQCYQ
ncbi:hypothetical protein KUTeg_024890 [Tegillarca granosa]|uniref:PLAT domain-containing protein n=1 Tax=Tegillarca granosa TaxID=220873 RepID=A0ABQ9DZ62_TEGGR|nr:hypothetical protein KUTeg_024890 [Tegillarca granosa]